MADGDVNDVGRIMSVFGANMRRNRWLLASDTTVFNVCGRSILDLRLAETRSDRVEMTVLAVLGSVMVVVPEGSDVRLSGSSFLASSDCLVEHTGEASHLPPIMVTATTVLGRMIVKSLPYGADAFPVKHKRIKKLKGRAGRVSRARARARALRGSDPVDAPTTAWAFDTDSHADADLAIHVEHEDDAGLGNGDAGSPELAAEAAQRPRAVVEREPAPAPEEPAVYVPVDGSYWPAGVDASDDDSTDASDSDASHGDPAPPAWAEARPAPPDPWPASEATAGAGAGALSSADETPGNLQASTLPAPTVMDEPFDPAQFMAAAKTSA